MNQGGILVNECPDPSLPTFRADSGSLRGISSSFWNLGQSFWFLYRGALAGRTVQGGTRDMGTQTPVVFTVKKRRSGEKENMKPHCENSKAGAEEFETGVPRGSRLPNFNSSSAAACRAHHKLQQWRPRLLDLVLVSRFFFDSLGLGFLGCSGFSFRLTCR